MPPYAGECHFVRGDSVGNHAVDPDLWEFCGAEDTRLSEVPGRQEHPGNATGAVRRPGSDHGATFGVAASSCGVTHAAPDRWHVRVVLPPGMPGT